MAVAYARCASIARALGTGGDVALVPEDGLESVLGEGMEVAIVPPALTFERFQTIEAVAPERSVLRAHLSKTGDRAQAQELVGRAVLVAADALAEAGDGRAPGTRLRIGARVVDRTLGPLGRLVAIESGVGQERLVVDGPFGEVLIPHVGAIVIEVGEDEIVVDCPKGLVP